MWGAGVALGSPGLIRGTCEWLCGHSRNSYVGCVTGRVVRWRRSPRDEISGSCPRSRPATGAGLSTPAGRMPDAANAGQAEGPRGVEPRGPSSRQHRRQGSAGAWKRRRGVAPLACTSGDGAVRGPGTGTRAVYASCWTNRAPATVRPSPVHFCKVRPAGPGRPRSRPFSWVTGLLSPAVRSLPWSEVPRRTARSVRLIAPVSHAWFFRARGWLARTPGPTTPGGTRSRAGRVRAMRTSVRRTPIQILPRHSSSSVIARAVPGLPSACR